MRLFNTLSRKIEEFKPLNPPNVTLYTCGPTVYDYVSIGNLRTYTAADLLVRVVQFNGFNVKYIINITDVGHLTGDNLGDADRGEDRMEKASKRENRSAWDIAKFYEEEFKKDFTRLNLIAPERWTRATEHIRDQIELINQLEKKGFTYKTSDGIYFDTSRFPSYGKLSLQNRQEIKEGARVKKNLEKRNPTDFALWKFSPKGQKRQMEWESPWGVGFPGWHVECSAMSMKYLGESFDIHAGGEDLAPIHHTNEIAQSEAATDKPFVKYWVHAAFMMVNGQRMGKSLGNNYRLDDLIKKDFEPMTLRYLYLQTHYRQKMNFTWESLKAAQEGCNKLKEFILSLKSPNHPTSRTILSEEKLAKIEQFKNRFVQAISNDLQMPQAVAVMWEMLKSNIPSTDKLDLLLEFDQVFGFKLNEVTEEEIPAEITLLAIERKQARSSGDFGKSDKLRDEIHKKGYIIEDVQEGYIVKKIK